eukprot:5547317-Prymnesium_polylepis.1
MWCQTPWPPEIRAIHTAGGCGTAGARSDAPGCVERRAPGLAERPAQGRGRGTNRADARPRLGAAPL